MSITPSSTGTAAAVIARGRPPRPPAPAPAPAPAAMAACAEDRKLALSATALLMVLRRDAPVASSFTLAGASMPYLEKAAESERCEVVNTGNATDVSE